MNRHSSPQPGDARASLHFNRHLLFSRHRDIEDMAPSIVVHHERSSSEPGPAGTTSKPALKTDSTTMTDPGVSTPSSPGQDRPGTWPAPRTQKSFDQSAQVRPCSSQVIESRRNHPATGSGGARRRRLRAFAPSCIPASSAAQRVFVHHNGGSFVDLGKCSLRLWHHHRG